ncbi:hypothetical protein V8B97DRAFT_1844741, partial [Scleroderma yunnanense]
SDVLADDITCVNLSIDDLALRRDSRMSIIFLAIHGATNHCCHLRWTCICPKIRELWIRMIEGDDPTEDIWLWVDGDEEWIRKQDLPNFFQQEVDVINKSDWTDAQSALRHRISQKGHSRNKGGNHTRQHTSRNERIRNTTPGQRLAAIVWLISNSKVVRDLTIELGRIPQQVYQLADGMDWIICQSWRAFPQVSAWEEAVTRLRVDGCICMQEIKWIEPSLRSWFNMLTWLDGKPPIMVINIGWHPRCTRCRSWAKAGYDEYQCDVEGTHPSIPLWDALCWHVITSECFDDVDPSIQLLTATILSRTVGPGVRKQVEQQLRSQVILDEADIEFTPHLNGNYPGALRWEVAQLSCGLPLCSEDLTQSLSVDIPDAVLDEAPLGIKLGVV